MRKIWRDIERNAMKRDPAPDPDPDRGDLVFGDLAVWWVTLFRAIAPIFRAFLPDSIRRM
jgi:hypothetical protein